MGPTRDSYFGNQPAIQGLVRRLIMINERKKKKLVLNFFISNNSVIMEAEVMIFYRAS